MSPQEKLHREIRELLLSAAAGEAGHEEWARLNALLGTDASARDYVVLLMHQMSALEWSASDAIAQVQCELQRAGEPRPAATSCLNDRRRRTSLFRSLAALAAILLVGGFGIWLSGFIQVARQVADEASATPNLTRPAEERAAALQADSQWAARLTQSTSDATWGEGSGPNDFLLRLRPGQAVELLSGLAELKFASGAVVILHGPCRFIPTGPDSATLERGRLTGRVDNGNFRLLTPSAQVVDLGTEFGVDVDDAANTDVIVFEGEVSVTPHEQQKRRRVESIFLDGGATARIGIDGELATGIAVEWQAFRRAIPTTPTTAEELLSENQLSLIDIVNGGDGRSGILAGAIDPLTGTWDRRPWRHEHGPGTLSGDRKYHRSESHPMIDGLFVPPTKGKDTLITSSGLRADLPKNVGRTFGPIWARRRGDGALPSMTGDFWGTGTLPFIIRRIEVARIGALGMHPNVGMTLDLHDCSEPYRGRFRAFEATLVNLDLVVETDPDGLRRAPVRTADFWVFVDGELKYSRANFGRDLDGEQFQVELKPNDRFLTLVSTDGGNSTSFDHVLLIDPVFTLSELAGRSSTQTSAEK